jgi:hypothetical protein
MKKKESNEIYERNICFHFFLTSTLLKLDGTVSLQEWKVNTCIFMATAKHMQYTEN